MRDKTLKYKLIPATAFLVILLVAGCAAPPVKPPPAPSARPPAAPLGGGVIEGRLLFPGNISAAVPVEVSGGGRSTTGHPDGTYVLAGLPPGRIFLTAEAKEKAKRYLAVAVERLGENERLPMDLEMRDATNVDTFCADCHPVREKQTRRDQIVRDVHHSDVKPSRAKKNLDGVLDSRGYVTCESCHTIHEETGVPHFVKYSYEDGELCMKCH